MLKNKEEISLRGNDWISLIERNPEKDGSYYVYILNCMDGINGIRIADYKNKKWHEFNDKYTKILAWKKRQEKAITDETTWLKKHHNEIKKAFHYDEIDYKYLCIAETLEECLCEYEWFLWNDYVRYIDGVFVIRII